MTIKHLLFDVDGTLLDSREAFCGSLQRALERHHIAHGDIAPYFTRPLSAFMADYAIADPDFLPQWNADYVASLARAPLFGGVARLLQQLAHTGVQMAVVTSRLHAIALTGLSENGVAHHFADAIAADDVQHPKPSPEPVQLYLERHRARADEALFVGDAVTDRQCALAAGVPFVAPAWAPLPLQLEPHGVSMEQLVAMVAQR